MAQVTMKRNHREGTREAEDFILHTDLLFLQLVPSWMRTLLLWKVRQVACGECHKLLSAMAMYGMVAAHG